MINSISYNCYDTFCDARGNAIVKYNNTGDKYNDDIDNKKKIIKFILRIIIKLIMVLIIKRQRKKIITILKILILQNYINTLPKISINIIVKETIQNVLLNIN